ESWDGTQDPETHFQYYEQLGVDQKLPHVKAWKNNGQTLHLADTGGHLAVTRGFIHPESLILKHYPIRNSDQGNRKIFRERKPRYPQEERRKGWHVQYDHLSEGMSLIRDPKELKKWQTNP